MKTPAASVFLALLLCGAGPQLTAADRGEDPAMQHASAALLAGDYPNAMRGYTRILAADPKNAIAFVNRGICRTHLRDPVGAEADFTRALKIDPKLAIAYLNRSNSYLERGELDKCIADCDEAISLDPQLAHAHVNPGWARWLKKDAFGARTDLDRAVTLDPRSVPARVNAGRYAASAAIWMAQSTMPVTRWRFRSSRNMHPLSLSKALGILDSNGATRPLSHLEAYVFIAYRRHLEGRTASALEVLREIKDFYPPESIEYVVLQQDFKRWTQSPAP